MPGTREVFSKIVNKNFSGLTSMVMCFEDAITEDQLTSAEQNVLSLLAKLNNEIESNRISFEDIPLIFIRVRNPDQFIKFSRTLSKNHIQVLSGFVFPKFYSFNSSQYLQELAEINKKYNSCLYGMPILEGRSIAYKESRLDELLKLLELMSPFSDYVLNVRVGGTDFSAIFGVRRGMQSSIYDILTVRDCLTDILNIFNRDTCDYTVSAPVWEYFLAYKGADIMHLLDTDIQVPLLSRNTIINPAIDGLLREIILDKANGFVGKTIIHPSHLKYVNAMQAVTREEYEDAEQILNTRGGVIKSAKANKMNEVNPHRLWAKKVLRRGDAYGVIENETDYLKLMLEVA